MNPMMGKAICLLLYRLEWPRLKCYSIPATHLLTLQNFVVV